eukprot:1476750-Prymnesium_polylepis.1
MHLTPLGSLRSGSPLGRLFRPCGDDLRMVINPEMVGLACWGERKRASRPGPQNVPSPVGRKGAHGGEDARP